jgi:hypothetical protein
MVRLQGLAGQGPAPSYWPWPDENAVEGGQPTSLTLWIDKQASLVLRSKMSAQLYKRTAVAVEKATVTAPDTFTIAAPQAPPDDVFRFTPPEGATEVANVALRRNRK